MAQDIGDALGDWLVSLGEEMFELLKTELYDEAVKVGNEYFDDYDSVGESFFNEFVSDFYYGYIPTEYERKYDLWETYSSNDDEIVLQPDNLREFKSGYDKEEIFGMIKDGIRFIHPRSHIPITYSSTAEVEPGVPYVPVLKYTGTLQGAVDYWNKEVFELYREGYDRKLDDVAMDFINRYI